MLDPRDRCKEVDTEEEATEATHENLDFSRCF